MSPLPVVVRSEERLLWTVLLFAAAARALVGPHIVDDAFITFRYSRHLAAWEGFTYNPPAHVLGTTTPLLTLTLAAGELAGLSSVWVSFVIATLADLITILLVVDLLRRAGFRAAGLLAGAAIASWPGYVTWSVSGMETSLYVALVTLAFHALSEERLGRASVWSGLAGVCRPDGALVAVAIGALLARRSVRSSVRYLAIVGAMALPWVVFATLYFGSPVPSSVVAKATGADPGWTAAGTFARYFLGGRYLAFTALAVIGSGVLWATGSVALRAWHAWWLLYASVFLAANVFVSYLWYFVPLLPLYLSGIAVAAERGARWLARGSRVARWPARAVLPATLLAVLIVGGWRLAAHARDMGAWATGREQLYQATATELAHRAPKASCTLAATEIGTLGFYYPGPILDLVGLVSPEALGRDPGEVLHESQAAWLVTYDDHFDRRIVSEPWFGRTFRLIRRVPVSAARALEVYERVPSPCQ